MSEVEEMWPFYFAESEMTPEQIVELNEVAA